MDFVAARWRSLKSEEYGLQDPRSATLDQLYSNALGASAHPLFEASKARPTRWMLVTAWSLPSSAKPSRRAASSPAPAFAAPSASASPSLFANLLDSKSSSSQQQQHLMDFSFNDEEVSSNGAGEMNPYSGTPTIASAGRKNLNSSSGSVQSQNSASGSLLAVRSTRTRRLKRKRTSDPSGKRGADSADDDSYQSPSDDDTPLELPGGRDAAYLLDLPRKKPKVYTPEELSYDASKIPADELLERVKDSKLTNLQILISISIIRSANYEARLDYILDFVCQHYTYLLGRDGNPKATDPKRAVLASLSKNASSSPLFVKVGDVWKIGPKNVLYGSKEVIPGLMEYITVSKSPGDSVELTELQKMIMRAISLEGGTCGLEKIYDYVKLRYDRLKRRDGSSYATNARRAIQASLSNNSSNRPIFQLVGSNDDEETLWSLTERGLESLEMINTNEPEVPLSLDEQDLGVSESASVSEDDSTTATPSLPASMGSGTKQNSVNLASPSPSPSGSPQKASQQQQQLQSTQDAPSKMAVDEPNVNAQMPSPFQPAFQSFRHHALTSGSLSPSSITEATDGPSSVDESEEESGSKLNAAATASSTLAFHSHASSVASGTGNTLASPHFSSHSAL